MNEYNESFYVVTNPWVSLVEQRVVYTVNTSLVMHVNPLLYDKNLT